MSSTANGEDILYTAKIRIPHTIRLALQLALLSDLFPFFSLLWGFRTVTFKVFPPPPPTKANNKSLCTKKISKTFALYCLNCSSLYVATRRRKIKISKPRHPAELGNVFAFQFDKANNKFCCHVCTIMSIQLSLPAGGQSLQWKILCFSIESLDRQMLASDLIYSLQLYACQHLGFYVQCKQESFFE